MKALNVNYVGQTRLWWLILLAGILLVIGGFAYWFWPQAGYAVASQIFGWLLVLAGVVQLCASVATRQSGIRGWWLAGGMIDIFIGFMLVRSIILSEMVFPYFLAVVFIFWGIEALVRACTSRGRYRWVGAINGILLAIIGFFFLEAGFVGDMFMVSFLSSIAFIYWGFTIAIASYDMKPVEKK